MKPELDSTLALSERVQSFAHRFQIPLLATAGALAVALVISMVAFAGAGGDDPTAQQGADATLASGSMGALASGGSIDLAPDGSITVIDEPSMEPTEPIDGTDDESDRDKGPDDGDTGGANQPDPPSDAGYPFANGAKPAVKGLLQRGKEKDNESNCDTPVKGTDGLYCDIQWKDIEPRKGEYNFSMIDKAVGQAMDMSRETGKYYAILLRIRGGVYAPDWAKSQAGSSKWDYRDNKTGFTLINFWESGAWDAYEHTQAALAKRYDGNNAVGAVAAGLCMTYNNEIMWNRLGREESWQGNWKSMTANGYTYQKDYKCLEAQQDVHAKVWKRTPTFFASHHFQRHTRADEWPVYEDHGATERLFDRCRKTLGKRCVLSNNQLMPSTSTDGVNGLIGRHSAAGYPTGYQTHVFNSDGLNGRPYNFQALLDSIDRGASLGAQSVELPEDWECSNEIAGTGCSSSVAQSRLKEMAKGQAALKRN